MTEADKLARVMEVADRLAESTLSGDNYLLGRASGFRMAAELIREAIKDQP